MRISTTIGMLKNCLLNKNWRTLGCETAKYHNKRVKSPNYGKISNIPKDEVVESNKKVLQ